jgi:hypothetical protein
MEVQMYKKEVSTWARLKNGSSCQMIYRLNFRLDKINVTRMVQARSHK